jgi:plastocyanin
MTHQSPTNLPIVLPAALLVVFLLAPAAAFAEAPKPPPGAGAPAAEVDGLRKEVADLRQMLLQSKQAEQQNRDLLLKLMQAGGRAGSPTGPAAPMLRSPAAPPPPVVSTGRITGTVYLSGVPANQPVYAFVEDLRGPPVQGHTVDLMQRERQFWPQVVAVQRGTTAFFPNFDRATHNVFSASRTSTFDLGQLHSGDRGKPILLNDPGVIEIYCDVHPGEWAEVLVTPNGHFTRVSGGSFRLLNVPVGERVIAVWTAGAEPKRQTLALTPQGANLEFVLNVPPRKTSHPNKAGQAYSSTGP